MSRVLCPVPVCPVYVCPVSCVSCVLCLTSRPRGWLGGEPSTDSGIDEGEMEEWTSSEEEGEEARSEEARREEERKRRRRRKPKRKPSSFEEDEYEEEIEGLHVTGIRNKIQTVSRISFS